jgi:hypothetical protein
LAPGKFVALHVGQAWRSDPPQFVQNRWSAAFSRPQAGQSKRSATAVSFSPMLAAPWNAAIF